MVVTLLGNILPFGLSAGDTEGPTEGDGFSPNISFPFVYFGAPESILVVSTIILPRELYYHHKPYL